MSKKKRPLGPMDDASKTPPELPTRRPTQGPGWGFAAVILAVIAAIVAGVALREGSTDPAMRDPIEGADVHELEMVVRAVSVIIQTPDGAPQEPPVRALESLHPQSAGGADLHDACVTTYRGMLELERMRAELLRLVPMDAGAQPPSREDQTRAAEILERSQQRLREVNQTRERCATLYEAAARRLGVQPARRSTR